MVLDLGFPQKNGFFSWEELQCLAKALGFQEDLFVRNFPVELTQDSTGLTTERLLDILEKYSYLNAAIDKTVNIHRQGWNLAAITKCVTLLDRSLVTFRDIQLIRVSYQFYETSSGRGLPTDENVLLNVIKMCNRMISPLKLAHRLKHMKLEDSEHLQLHELLDLLLWCELYDKSVAGDLRPSTGVRKDGTGCYEMADFDSLLRHADQRIYAALDDRYHGDELVYSREKHVSRSLSRDVLPVNRSAREDQVRRAKSQHTALRSALKRSHDRVRQTRLGYFLDEPFDFDDLSESRVSTRCQSVSLCRSPSRCRSSRGEPAQCQSPSRCQSVSVDLQTLSARPPTVQQITGRWVRPHTTSAVVHTSGANTDLSRRSLLRPCVSSMMRRQSPLIVTAAERSATADSIDSACFDTLTAEYRYEQILQRDLKQLKTRKNRVNK